MSARLFVLVALASLVTVSYGLDCYVCNNILNGAACEDSVSSFNVTTCLAGVDQNCLVNKITTGGSTTTFARSCFGAATAEGCVTVGNIATCNSYCTTDGCNTGDGSSGGGGGAGMVRASALFLVVSAILAAVMH
ncbi:uncharacterized protein [Branchiostoma lanceolatum]|uniref:uncharacterized protein n=1 Tax=Branchiostoma lanceolatum TaxID=7740 RepID=UPI00345285CB